MSDDTFERGMKIRRAVLGDAHVNRAQANTTAFDADFQQFITEVAWGTVWVDGRAIVLQPTYDAMLQQVRYACKVIQHPRGGAEVDC